MNQNQLMARLLPLVNNVELWGRLEDYLEYEREKLIEQLLRSTDIRSINKFQGEVSRIDRLLQLPSITNVATS